MIHVLIIEDEEHSSKHLERLLEQQTLEIKVLATLRSVEETGVWLTKNESPDLIFMDIQLLDGLSLEIFENNRVKSPVIFVSAFNEYALPAFKTTGIDYLLKPVSKLDLESALAKYFENKILYYNQLNLNEFLHSKSEIKYKERFLVQQGNKHLPIKTEEIAFFYLAEGHTFIKCFTGESYLTKYTLSYLEEIIAPTLFIRLNRGVICNINALESIEKQEENYLVRTRPSFEKHIRISRDNYFYLKRLFSQ